ncbi:MAG: glucose 1-dehydrogenase [Phycisphaerales bacterium]|nr:glucose 1-dehydrogenase [Phycisphaerales bacterium]
MPRLENKVALITGAAQGIGLGIAQAFINEGAIVILTDINDELGIQEASQLGERASYIHLDVTDEQKWIEVIARILKEHGKLDILVNNAGITGFDLDAGPQDPEHASLDAWRMVHHINLDGTFLGCKHAIKAMRPAGTGSIINMSSRSGVVGIPRAAAYASSKAAIKNHTKTVALYCAEEGLTIRCNSIQPAAILTPMWDASIGTGEDRQANIAKFAAGTPMNRFGTVEEVAAIAIYLASDESGYTTGTEINIDGGLLAGVSAPPAPKKS